MYGGDPLLDIAATDFTASSGTTLKLPGTMLVADASIATAISGGGDIDNDGFDDLIISVSKAGERSEVYVLHGGDNLPSLLDLGSAISNDDVIQIKGFEGRVQAAIVGDLNGDGYDDLAATDSTTSYLFDGRQRQDWTQRRDINLNGDRQVFDFEGGSFDGFVTTGLIYENTGVATPTLWNTGNFGLGMGNTVRGYRSRFSVLGFNIDYPVSGRATSPLIDLRTVDDPVLHFDHLLSTDQRAGRDIARVYVEVDGSLLPLAGAINRGSGLLDDGDRPLREDFDAVSFSLAPYAGSQVRLVFDFNSVDQYLNDAPFFGWRIDNIRVEADDVSVLGANRTLSERASYIAGLGDLNGDGMDDLGSVYTDRLEIELSGSPTRNRRDQRILRERESPGSGTERWRRVARSIAFRE